MTYDEYWYGDPLMVRAFYKAEKIRQERMDAEAWLNGIYFKRAIESSIGNAFRAKHSDAIEYPDGPLLTEAKRREQEEAQQTIEQQTAFAKLYMMQMMEAGKNWGKNG